MGKTEKGAIWLTKELFSPYMIIGNFGEILMIEMLKKFLNFFTDIDPLEINIALEKEKNINNLKNFLANEATKILHGEKASKKQKKLQLKLLTKRFKCKSSRNKCKSLIIDKGLNLLEFLSNNQIVISKVKLED